MERQVVYNAIQTPDGTLLVSRHRHDYVAHEDTITKKYYAVDGGHDYVRYVGNVINECKMITHYADEPHEIIREFVEWGTYGINGDEELKYIKVKDMSISHIEAVLDECNIADWFENILLSEISFRRICQ